MIENLKKQFAITNVHRIPYDKIYEDIPLNNDVQNILDNPLLQGGVAL
jgi:hypothetical protein